MTTLHLDWLTIQIRESPMPADPTYRPIFAGLLACAFLFPPPAVAQTAAPSSDGQHDFDFEIGTWKTEMKVLAEPLSETPDQWLAFNGTSTVRKVWDGRANLLELEADSAAGHHIEGLSLRVYNPKARQWSVHFSNARVGTLTPPVYGRVTNGHGLFQGQDFLDDGRAVLVRFEILPQAPDVYRFVQSFSADGGKTWEENWIATDTRISS
ncbi:MULTISPECIES: hypothetical protein [Inquilinus]|uniref:DUF1579 domain-containing protein n=1 Tax=Inquilinus ginsengisoli TaxID=363840 RepID=A0ABU1JHW6_9PROT|nr:hypothetical protein [Inquilinus ginsengisoli]MDR6287922.1 hypothetical protein [Inquilinus ginsengisoli]